MITSHTLKTTLVGTLLFGGIALAGLSITAGTAQAFNPQPDPPGKPLAPGTIQGFNPQPDPPGVIRVSRAALAAPDGSVGIGVTAGR